MAIGLCHLQESVRKNLRFDAVFLRNSEEPLVFLYCAAVFQVQKISCFSRKGNLGELELFQLGLERKVTEKKDCKGAETNSATTVFRESWFTAILLVFSKIWNGRRCAVSRFFIKLLCSSQASSEQQFSRTAIPFSWKQTLEFSRRFFFGRHILGAVNNKQQFNCCLDTVKFLTEMVNYPED